MATAVILGAGDLGGATARQIAAADVVSSVIIVDEAASVAAGKALDICQAAPVDSFVTRISGTASLDAVISADFVVLADRSGQSAEWQGDAAVGLLTRATALNGRAAIICAGASQAGVVERAVREIGLPRSRIFGTAPEAFRSAAAAIAALEAGCATTDVNLVVLGRPPDQLIVPWEDASIAGRRATSVLTPPAIARLDARLVRLWPPGPLTLASAVARAIDSALNRAARSFSAFVAVTRDEGALGRVAMLPVTLAPLGISSVVTPTLSTRDAVRLQTVLSS